MSKVIRMTGHVADVAGEPNKEVIEAVERMLDEARHGKIQHIICITSDGKHPPQDFYAGSGEPTQVMTMVGIMELCKHTILMNFYDEERSDT